MVTLFLENDWQAPFFIPYEQPNTNYYCRASEDRAKNEKRYTGKKETSRTNKKLTNR